MLLELDRRSTGTGTPRSVVPTWSGHVRCRDGAGRGLRAAASVACLFLVSAPWGCGGGSDDSPDDELSFDLAVAEPPEGDEFASPLGMNQQGIVVGYAGPEPRHPRSRPIRVLLEVPPGATTEVVEDGERRFGFAHGVNDEGIIENAANRGAVAAAVDDASDQGSIVVGEYNFEPTAWIGQTRVTLAVPDGFASGVARSINHRGLVVGSFADYDDAGPPGPRPCYWPTPTDPPVRLRTLSPDHPLGTATSVSKKDRIAGTLSSPQGFVAVTWETPEAAPVIVGRRSVGLLAETRGLNGGGDIAARGTLPGGVVGAFLARAGSEPVNLPFLPSRERYAEPFGINDEGRVVGTSRAADGTTRAVLWERGQVIDLNDRLTGLPANVRYLSSAVAIDNLGRIAVEVVLTGGPGGPGDFRRTVGILVPVED